MSGTVTLRFHEELGDFLPPERRDVRFAHVFRDAGSVKDLVESLGVPHPEIDVILVNGASVDFRHAVRDGDVIEVHPRFEARASTPALIHLRPPLPPSPRFVLDTHLGRLAAYLRMLGFDTLYRNDYEDAELARISSGEERMLLTCDRGLLMRKQIALGYFVRERQPRRQLREIVARLRLAGSEQPFTRCMRCNGMLQDVDKHEIETRLPPHVRASQEKFRRCADCGGIYWPGTHYRRMLQLIADTHRAAPRYPAELEEHVEFEGAPVVLRPIRPEDEDAHRAFLESLRPEDVHFRFLGFPHGWNHEALLRYTHIDYVHEMAFVAVESGGARRTLGVVRAIREPQSARAEFAIVVRSDVKGHGLGHILLDKLIRYCRPAGIDELTGQVLADNARMLNLAREFGFDVAPAEDGVRTATLRLPGGAA